MLLIQGVPTCKKLRLMIVTKQSDVNDITQMLAGHWEMVAHIW